MDALAPPARRLSIPSNGAGGPEPGPRTVGELGPGSPAALTLLHFTEIATATAEDGLPSTASLMRDEAARRSAWLAGGDEAQPLPDPATDPQWAKAMADPAYARELKALRDASPLPPALAEASARRLALQRALRAMEVADGSASMR